MSEWIGFYILDLFFWLWVLKYGGARLLFVRFLCLPIVFLFKLSHKSEEEAVRLIAYITIIGHTIVFIIGLFSPQFRLESRMLFF